MSDPPPVADPLVEAAPDVDEGRRLWDRLHSPDAHPQAAAPYFTMTQWLHDNADALLASADRVQVLTAALENLLAEFIAVDKILADERSCPQYKPDPIIARTRAALNPGDHP